jgi:branched-chain amino acid transport system permease protein
MLVIGGTGYLYGGLIGAVVFKILQEFFSNLTPEYWQFWIGLGSS